MDLDLEIYLIMCLADSYLSVINSPNGVNYALHGVEGEQITLTCNHAYSTGSEIYANYGIFVDGELEYGITLPTLHEPTDAAAQTILNLFKICSAKIISQEQQAQRAQFLKSFSQKTN